MGPGRPSAGSRSGPAGRPGRARATSRCRRSRPSGAARRSPPRPRSSRARASRPGAGRRAASAATASAASWKRWTLPLPPHWATSRPPGASAACRRAKRASWSPIQWKTAFEKPASTGSSSVSSVRSARNTVVARDRARARACATIDAAESTATTVPARQALEQHPRHAARAAAGVEHGLVAAQRQPLEHRAGPLHLRRRDAVVGRRVPVARHPQARGDRAGALALGLVAVDRVAVLERHADVVQALEEAPLDLGVDLERGRAPRPSGPPAPRGRSTARPAAISARTSSSGSTTGSRPIFVQFE